MDSEKDPPKIVAPETGATAAGLGIVERCGLEVASYITVPAVLLPGEQPLGFAVYRRRPAGRDGSAAELALFKSAGDVLAVADLAELTHSEPAEPLYVAADRYDDYHRRAESRMAAMLTDVSLGQPRFELAVQLVVQLVEELLDRPSEDLMARLRSAVGQLVEHAIARPEDLRGLLDCRGGEYDTPYHMVNVALLAMLAGQAMNLPVEDQRTFVSGALLHDIGKIGLPENLLRKEGRLTEGEWVLYREHAARGGQWLRNLGGDPLVIEMALAHHETMDGQGYPGQLPGERIHRWARMLAVLDSYDRLVTSRPFRPAQSVNAAQMILKAERDRFDSAAVDLVVKLIAEGQLAGLAALPTDVTTDSHGSVAALEGFLPLPPASMTRGVAARPTPQQQAELERRHYPRHQFSTSCRVQFVRPGASAEAHIGFWVHTLDISRSGLQFLHTEPLRLGEVVSVFLPSPRQGRQVNAMVVRCRRGSGGLYCIAARFDY